LKVEEEAKGDDLLFGKVLLGFVPLPGGWTCWCGITGGCWEDSFLVGGRVKGGPEA